MPKDIIKYNQDVASSDVQQGLDKVLSTYKAINAEIIKLKGSKITVPKGTSGVDAKSLNQITKQRITDTKKITALKKEQLKVEKEVVRIRKQELSASEALGKQRSKALGQQAKLIQKEKELISTSKQQVRSIEDLRKKNNALVKTRDRLNITTKKGASEFRRLTGAIAQNEKSLKKYDKAIGRSQRNVGNYGKSIKGLAGQFGGALGLIGIMLVARRALVGMFNTFKDFDKAQSKLASILGTTKKGVSELTGTAIQLGSEMIFTASQVSSLQTELAKLGFDSGEIVDAQRGILNLAAATGFDLAEAAAVSGAALRSFGLDAREMGRITDVMALATSKSALDMSKLATALPTVASTAKVAGVSIERTTALLGVLSDRGLDASTSATSLRNVFLELSKKGLTWEQAMAKINTATDKNVAALELFGKRGATTGVILAENAVSADELEEALNGAAGAAERMAEVQLDNLSGDITKMTSAWEGLVLTIEKGDGIIAKSFRFVIQGLADMLNGFAALGDDTNLEKGAKLGESAFNSFKQSIINTEQELRKGKILKEFKRINLEIKKIELEKIKRAKEFVELIDDFSIKETRRLEKERLASERQLASLQKQKELIKEGGIINLEFKTKFSKAEIAEIKRLEKKAALDVNAIDTIKGLSDEISRLQEIRSKSNDKERIADLAIEIQLYENMKKALEDLGKVPIATARKRRELGDDPIKLADEEDLVIAERQVEETTTAMLEAIEKKGDSINTGDTFLAKLLGITDEDAENLKSSLQEIASITAEFLDSQFAAQQDAARKEADFRQTEIERLRDERRDALLAQQQGNANELRNIDEKIKEEERLRDIAIANEAEAVRKRQVLATIVQISNLVLAASEIFASDSKAGAPGVIIAIAAIATMLSAFAGFKAQSQSLESGGIIDGNVIDISGKRHSQGSENPNDHYNIEAGEKAAIFNRTASKKHDKLIRSFTHAVNSGNLSSLQFAKTPNIEQNDFNIMLSTAELQQQNSVIIANQERMITLMSAKQQIEKGLWIDPFGNITSNRVE